MGIILLSSIISFSIDSQSLPYGRGKIFYFFRRIQMNLSIFQLSKLPKIPLETNDSLFCIYSHLEKLRDRILKGIKFFKPLPRQFTPRSEILWQLVKGKLTFCQEISLLKSFLRILRLSLPKRQESKGKDFPRKLIFGDFELLARGRI